MNRKQSVLLSTSLKPISLFPQAYEEVQGFFTSSFPTSVFRDLTKALDSKCQAVDKLLALLKDLAVGKSRINHTIFSY